MSEQTARAVPRLDAAAFERMGLRPPARAQIGTPTVDVVVVTYESRRDLERCFASIERAAAYVDARIIVVDNASADGSLQFCLDRSAGRTTGLAMPVNRGYAAAVNAAAAVSGADYLVVLNPDIALPDGDEIARLVDHLEAHPAAAAAAPRLLDPDGAVQSSARVVPSLSMLLARQTRFGATAAGRRRAARYLRVPATSGSFGCVEWALGAALAVRRRDWDRVGGWDGGYFLYFEDVDFCTRLRRAGRQVHYLPDVEMVHEHRRASDRAHGSALKSAARRAHIRSALRFFRKHPACTLRRLSDDGAFVPTVSDVVRRLLDVVVAGSLLVLLAPLLALIALAVRQDTAGPALVRERRLGKGGRAFTLYKFRTTCAAATRPDAAEEVVTAVGGLLRRWSLDGLPQLVNVLRGEMALVGFRAPAEHDVVHYRSWWHGRFEVKPGVTGLWRVRDADARTYEDMVLCDLEYVQRRTLRLDLALLLRTPVTVLGRREAV